MPWKLDSIAVPVFTNPNNSETSKLVYWKRTRCKDSLASWNIPPLQKGSTLVAGAWQRHWGPTRRSWLKNAPNASSGIKSQEWNCRVSQMLWGGRPCYHVRKISSHTQQPTLDALPDIRTPKTSRPSTTEAAWRAEQSLEWLRIAFNCDDEQGPLSSDRSFQWASEKQPNEGPCNLIEKRKYLRCLNDSALNRFDHQVTIRVRSSDYLDANVITKRKTMITDYWSDQTWT